VIVGTFNRDVVVGDFYIFPWITNHDGQVVFDQPVFVVRQCTREEWIASREQDGILTMDTYTRESMESSRARFYEITFD
jgi:hypothetical protein